MKNRFSAALCLACIVAMMFVSCSKDRTALTRELLAQVPANASLVAVADGEQLMEKAGSAKAITDALGTAASSESKQIIAALGEAWKPSPIVIFTVGAYQYMSTFVDDPDAAKEAFEKQGMTLADHGGILTSDKVAFKDNRLWVLLSKGAVNPENIKDFVKLGEKQSFLASDYAEKLVESDEDIEFIADFSSMIPAGDAIGGKIVSSVVVSNPTYLAGSVDFEKGEAECDIKVLDSKYQPAKYLLPPTAINVDELKKIGGTADGIVAFAYSKELGESIGGILKMVGAKEFTSFFDALSGGTLVVMSGKVPGTYRGEMPISGSNTTELQEMMQLLGVKTEIAGNRLIINPAVQVEGSIDVARQADAFKDAAAGVLLHSSNAYAQGRFPDGSIISVMLHVTEGTPKLKLKVEVPGATVNYLRLPVRPSAPAQAAASTDNDTIPAGFAAPAAPEMN